LALPIEVFNVLFWREACLNGTLTIYTNVITLKNKTAAYCSKFLNKYAKV
jgi:hypothetical protein